MNKEEILDVLDSIRVQVSEAKVFEYDSDERVNEVEDLLRVIEDTKAEIKTISEKLTNDDNYIQDSVSSYAESTIFYLEDRLKARKIEEENNLVEIKKYQSLVESAQKSIAYHEDIISLAISTQKSDSMDFSGLTEEEVEQLKSTQNIKQETIESYKENLDNIKEDLADYQTKLNTLLSKTEGLKAAREEAELQLGLYSKEANRKFVDEEAKVNDKRKLSDAEERLIELEKINDLLSYDHEKRLLEMIEDYKNDVISYQKLLEELTEFKASLNEKLNNGENYSASIEDKIEKEITELKLKLANEDNYIVSPSIVEEKNRDVIKTQRYLDAIEAQIRGYVEENEYLEKEIEAINKIIERDERKIEDCQRQLHKFDDDIDPELENLLLASKSSNKSNLAYLENIKLESTRILEHNSIELELLTSKLERFRVVYERMHASLNSANSVDLLAIRLDENELARKQAALAVLRRRGFILNENLIENIDKVLGAQFVENKDDELEEINSTMPALDESAKPQEETKDNIIPEEKSDEMPSVSNFDELESKFGMDPIGLGDTRGWKFKYSDVEDEDLSKKAKDKKFVGKLKGFFNIVLNIIPYTMALTTGLVMAGFHPIKTAKAVKAVLKRVQENPEKYDGITEEKVRVEIEKEISADSVKLEEQPAEALMDEGNFDSIFPETPNDEVVISTSDGDTISIDVSGSEETLEVDKIEAIPMEESSDLESEINTNELSQQSSSTNEDDVDFTAENNFEELLKGLPKIDEEAFKLDLPVEETEVPQIENGVNTEEVEEKIVEDSMETTLEPNEVENKTLEENPVATITEENLNDAENEVLNKPVENTEKTIKSSLSEEEIKSIIAQVAQLNGEYDYDISENEVEAYVRKLG